MRSVDLFYAQAAMLTRYLYEAEGGRYRELYDKQYKLEANRFINPGEDFTPEPEKAAKPKASSARSL